MFVYTPVLHFYVTLININDTTDFIIHSCNGGDNHLPMCICGMRSSLPSPPLFGRSRLRVISETFPHTFCYILIFDLITLPLFPCPLLFCIGHYNGRRSNARGFLFTLPLIPRGYFHYLFLLDAQGVRSLGSLLLFAKMFSRGRCADERQIRCCRIESCFFDLKHLFQFRKHKITVLCIPPLSFRP